MSGRKVPRFMETLQEASKPALKQLISIKRPFGLHKPILLGGAKSSKFDLSGSQFKQSIFSAEARERRQKNLDHDIAHSPLYESKSFNNVQGKIFTPPISYFRKDKSLFFPDFIGETLTKPEEKLSNLLNNKVTILRIYSTVSGDQVSKTYFETNNDGKNYLTDAYPEFESKFPKSQIIDINMPDTWLKKFVVKLSKGSIGKQLPKERLNSYFIAPYSTFPIDVRKTLNCDNSCSGYIYVLDPDSKLRWATSGSANEEERTLLWKCVSGLEKELPK